MPGLDAVTSADFDDIGSSPTMIRDMVAGSCGSMSSFGKGHNALVLENKLL